MITFKMVLGVVLAALYLLAWVCVILLGLALRAPRPCSLATLHVDSEDHAERGAQQAFTAEDDVDGGGARPSSLIPYYHHKPDRAYLLQLKYAVEKANEETVRKYGPLPPGGLPVQKKMKPKMPYRDFRGNLVPRVPIIQENDEMKLKEMAAAVTLAAGMVACDVTASSAVAAVPIETETVAQANGAPPSTGHQGQDKQDDPPTSIQPEFRDSFKARWPTARTDEEKLASIKEEFIFQDKMLNAHYKELHTILPDEKWKSLQRQQREWLTRDMTVCDEDVGRPIDSAYCRLYQTALRAYELEVMIGLEHDRH